MTYPLIRQVNAREYRLEEDITIRVGRIAWTVRRGFVYDGASIPRRLWDTIGSPFTGPYTVAALLHDALYVAHVTTRAEADSLFVAVARMYGCGRVRAWIMGAGLKLGGWLVWRRREYDPAYTEYLTVEAIRP